MSERKLAHIEKITGISPIEKADKLELVVVLGWQCVVQKNEFKVGDLVVYCEVDSILPERPEFEFTRKYNFRIKTQKLRGVISQGLILPLTILPNNDRPMKWGYIEGGDVTSILGITKYLSPSEKLEALEEAATINNEKNKLKKFLLRYNFFRRLFLSKKQKNSFPYWVVKTDEERIQNIPYVIEQFKDKEVYITEKIDYQSSSFTGKMISNTFPIIGKFLAKKFKFIVCSRNLVNNSKDSLYGQIAIKYNLESILRKNPTLVIQGEQGNGKVQGNKYELKEPKMWVFNIIDYKQNYHFNRQEMERFCKDNKLDIVPLIKTCKLSDIGSTVEDFVNFSKGNSVIKTDIKREGVVIRCIEGGKKVLSFKVINPDFLLKYD